MVRRWKYNPFGCWKFFFCSFGQKVVLVSRLQLTPPPLALREFMLGWETDALHPRVCNCKYICVCTCTRIHVFKVIGPRISHFLYILLLNSLNRGTFLSLYFESWPWGQSSRWSESASPNRPLWPEEYLELKATETAGRPSVCPCLTSAGKSDPLLLWA